MFDETCGTSQLQGSSLASRHSDSHQQACESKPKEEYPTMFNGLDHLAIVVPNTDEALKIWRDRVGLKFLYSEIVNNGAVRLTHLDLGNTHLQLVEPLTSEHPLKAWLVQNGPGLHHFCFKVDDVSAAQAELRAHQLPTAEVIHHGTQGKRALFLERSATQGVQVEVTGR